ncbi:hypothetical protein M3Y99_00032500 [Aphelenchoides fujianensis]|nr:hypothetical protein M3Y99_00032500 [Aphelenchoides fujianensis]
MSASNSRSFVLALSFGFLLLMPAVHCYPIKAAMPYDLQFLLGADRSLQSDLRRLDRLVDAGRSKKAAGCRTLDECLLLLSPPEPLPRSEGRPTVRMISVFCLLVEIND